MFKKYNWAPLSVILLFLGGMSGCFPLSLANSEIAPGQEEVPSLACIEKEPLVKAQEKAREAGALAQSATTAQEWHQVILNWMGAIEALQSIPLHSPKRVYAQKKLLEYQSQLSFAQGKAAQIQEPFPFPSFNSPFLDEQLKLFLSYQAAVKVPDVLIVGSSRALQGVNPQRLQQELASQNYSLEIFNFGLNGATAQTVDLLIREILTPQQLPRVIIWADGVRAFNSGRLDRTYQGIATSRGYQALKQGSRPQLPPIQPLLTLKCPSQPKPTPEIYWFSWLWPRAFANPLQTIDAHGFLPVVARFHPQTYYQTFPKIPGFYDGDYRNFNLQGEQTLALQRLLRYTTRHQVELVFINLPLTQDYLDRMRQQYEGYFRAFMVQQAQQQGFTFIDLSLLWPTRHEYFADPSHLNQAGAEAVSRSLAKNAQITWPKPRLSKPDGELD